MTQPDVDHLKKYISSMYPLPGEILEAFCAGWMPFECKRKTILTTAGEVERYLYFVLEGVQRAFYLGNDKQEATIIFTYPYSFAGVPDSFLSRLPSIVFFETLTTSRFLRIQHKQVADMMQQYPILQHFVLQATAVALHGVLQRQVELQCFSAEEKFKALLKRSPHVLQIIPHKYLASYLGIDASTFSKLLGSVKVF